MKLFKSFSNLKYCYIIIILLLYNNTLIGQVFPQGLMHNNNAYQPTIFHEGAFKTTSFYRDIYRSFIIDKPAAYIQSDFSFHFTNASQFTIQFTFYEEFYYLQRNNNILGFKDISNNSIPFYYQWTSSDYELNPIMNGVNLGNISNQNSNNYSKRIPKQVTTTYDGIQWVHYVNGVNRREDINTITFDFTGNLIFGIIGAKSNGYSLTFDEVKFWDKALTPDEIATNWNKSLIGNENGLQLYYNFNSQYQIDINNNKLIDLSPNKKNASFINMNELCNFENGSKYPILDSLIFKFDANNLDSYPGTTIHNNNNPPLQGNLYNLKDFTNNLKFYNNTNYNHIASPIYYADGGRSLGIQSLFGKSDFNTGIEGAKPITVESWVKFNSLNNNVFLSFGENIAGHLFELSLDANELKFDLGGEYNQLNTNPLTRNKWYHIVCSYDGLNNYTIYLNGFKHSYIKFGEIVQAKGANGIWVSTSNFHFTKNTPLFIGTSKHPFDGKIGTLNIYNKVFSDFEIYQKYSTNKMRFGY